MATRPEGLKARREQLGYTQEGVAEQLHVAVTTYRSWEQGSRRPRVGFRPRLARVLKVSLVEVGRWFDKRSLPPQPMTVPAWLGTLAALEQGASEVWTYQPVTIPGLLQTAAYADAVERADTVAGPPTDDEIDRWVSHRLARQEVLDRRPDPLRLSVVIDESVLYRVAGDGEIMAEQLDHLADIAERPTIDVRVLPLDRGMHAAAFGAFTVLTSPGETEPFLAVTLDRTSAHYLELPSVVQAHAALFRHAQEMARSRDESIDLFRTVAKERFTP